MKKLPFANSDHVLVVGLGKSGIAAARFLLGLGIKVSVSEGGRAVRQDREAVQWLQERGVYCELGGHSPELFRTVDWILLSPGVPLDIPALAEARRAGVPIIGELALAPYYLKSRVLAVTGTNGKSTVTTLLGDLLRAAGRTAFVGGNLGTPLCEYLAGPQAAEWAVLEVSSFQLDSAGDFRPEIGLLLNISPDHLDRYPDYPAYAASKWQLFAHQQAADYAIVNGDDQESKRLLAEALPRSACLAFTGPNGGGVAEWQASTVLLRPLPGQSELEKYDLAGTALAEGPNRENAAAAILAARLAGCPPAAIRDGLAAFRSLPHRVALVRELNGVRFYDDSKATNIGAVASALAGMERPVVLIAGGLDKGGDYRLLLPIVREKVKSMILIGSAREKMAAVFQDEIPVLAAPDLAAAVRLAYEAAGPGEAVLLSPACASFDMFEGYAHRGEVFRQAVAALSAGGGTGRNTPSGCGGAGLGRSCCPVLASLVA